MSNLALSVKNLKHQFAGGKTIHYPDFELAKESSVFIAGPSGSGKTTFLNLILGVHEIKQGEVKLLGFDLKKLSVHKRDQLRGEECGVIFQSHNLIPYLSVKQNIELVFKLNKQRLSRTKNANDEIAYLLKRLGLMKLTSTKAMHLSVGESQRVAIARALVGSPKLIVADEPTSALDEKNKVEFLGLIQELCAENKTSLLFVSHDERLKVHFKGQYEIQAQANEAQA